MKKILPLKPEKKSFVNMEVSLNTNLPVEIDKISNLVLVNESLKHKFLLNSAENIANIEEFIDLLQKNLSTLSQIMDKSMHALKALNKLSLRLSGLELSTLCQKLKTNLVEYNLVIIELKNRTINLQKKYLQAKEKYLEINNYINKELSSAPDEDTLEYFKAEKQQTLKKLDNEFIFMPSKFDNELAQKIKAMPLEELFKLSDQKQIQIKEISSEINKQLLEVQYLHNQYQNNVKELGKLNQQKSWDAIKGDFQVMHKISGKLIPLKEEPKSLPPAQISIPKPLQLPTSVPSPLPIKQETPTKPILPNKPIAPPIIKATEPVKPAPAPLATKEQITLEDDDHQKVMITFENVPAGDKTTPPVTVKTNF